MLLRGRADQALRLSEEGGGGLRDPGGGELAYRGGRTAQQRQTFTRAVHASRPPNRPPSPSYGWIDLAEGSSQVWGCAWGPAGGKAEFQGWVKLGSC